LVHLTIGNDQYNSLVNNLQPPSSLPQKANYWFFKEGVRPEWEDPTNQNGGKWTIEFEGKKDLGKPSHNNDSSTIHET
jgi:translation initiation factor 4E